MYFDHHDKPHLEWDEQLIRYAMDGNEGMVRHELADLGETDRQELREAMRLIEEQMRDVPAPTRQVEQP